MKYILILLLSLLFSRQVLAVDTVPSSKPVLPPPIMSQENQERTSQQYNGSVDALGLPIENQTEISVTPGAEAEATPQAEGDTTPAVSAAQRTGANDLWMWIVLGIVVVVAGVGFWLMKKKN